MRSKVFLITAAINICVLAILFGIWWANGQEDTWLYVTSVFIVLSSFLYIAPTRKDGGR